MSTHISSRRHFVTGPVPHRRGTTTGPLWFRVRVRKIEDHSTGPRDVPWMRVQWADSTLWGISFTDIVAMSRATDHDLSPWAPVTSELLQMPTIKDYSSPFDKAPEED
ncbi:hypothetical protein ACH4KT_31700 [Streptomyces anulatus]